MLAAQCHSALPPKQARLAVSSHAGLQQEERIVMYAAEWYVQRLLRDSDNLDISFSLAR